MDFFKTLQPAPADPIFGLVARYQKDPRPYKVDLGAGVYKTEKLEPYILPSVKKAEFFLLEQEKNKDYLAIDGLEDYVAFTKKLVFGENLERIYGAQTVGATAALRVSGAFLYERGLHKIYFSNPTWANHEPIFRHAGFEIGWYDYLTNNLSGLNFEKLIDALNKMESQSVVLFHASCHNPTGFDPTQEQWEKICDVVKQRGLFPLFDLSYQGFGVGVDEDSDSIRLFLNRGLSFAVAVSHAKNFGLYAERAGALYFICSTAEEACSVGSHIKPIIRGLYSNPPCHGARIVATILQQPELKKLWEEELRAMRERLSQMRKSLASSLQKKTNRFEFITNQKGMFSYTGLSKSQVDYLIDEYAIYLPKSGRINVAGLNHQNLQSVAEAILNSFQLAS